MFDINKIYYKHMKRCKSMKYYMFNGLNEENKSIKPKINKKKVWKTAILLFLILLILIFIFLYTKNEKCR